MLEIQQITTLALVISLLTSQAAVLAQTSILSSDEEVSKAFVKDLEHVRAAKNDRNFGEARRILEKQLPLVEKHANNFLPLVFSELEMLSVKAGDPINVAKYDCSLVRSIHGPGLIQDNDFMQPLAGGPTYTQAGHAAHSPAPPGYTVPKKRTAKASKEDKVITASVKKRSKKPQIVYMAGQWKRDQSLELKKTTEDFPLKLFTVSIAKDGTLQKDRNFTQTTPSDIDEIFVNIKKHIQQWNRGQKKPIDIVLYAHGGLNGESEAIELVKKHGPWWLANHVYPVYFVWHTGKTDALEELLGRKSDVVPFIVIDTAHKAMVEALIAFLVQCDDTMENYVRHLSLKDIWFKMKEKAFSSSMDINSMTWRDHGDVPLSLPGGTTFVSRLSKFIEDNPKQTVRIHLVGHSAGSIFCTGLLNAIDSQHKPVESMSFLAPAISFRDFHQHILPVLLPNNSASSAPPRLKKFNIFMLDEKHEAEDPSCMLDVGGFRIGYRHSLLYLVSRCFETEDAADSVSSDNSIVLMGLAKQMRDKPLKSLPETPASLVERLKGHVVLAPQMDSGADQHGAFPTDVTTMNSVLKTMIGDSIISAQTYFERPSK